MLKLVTDKTWHEFEHQYREHPSFIVPIFADNRAHPAQSQLVMLYVRNVIGTFVIPYDHPDAESVTHRPASWIDTCGAKKVSRGTPDAVVLAHACLGVTSVRDLRLQEGRETDSVTDPNSLIPSPMRSIYHYHFAEGNLNRVVPLMQLVQWCDNQFEHWKAYVDWAQYREPTWYDMTVPKVLYTLEEAGIHVEHDAFLEKFGEKLGPHVVGDRFYTQYNPHTITGRVTSHFAGVNTSALNKRDGTRKVFTSRWRQGNIVTIDFESFHLRLLGQLLNYPLPSDSVHTYFGQQYFHRSVLTPAQYEESKKITFRNLFGDARTGELDFFQKVYTFQDTLYNTLLTQGYVESQRGRRLWLRQIDTPTPSKVFNYFLQTHEMEVTLELIAQLGSILHNVGSKLIFYTYDAITLDYCNDDGPGVLRAIVRTLEAGGKYPVRIHAGKNYDEMIDITQLVKS